MTPVLPFWLQTAEWDIDDDANIVFTPHCPHQEFVHNDDDDGFGHNDDDDDDSIKLNDDDDDSFSHNDGNDYTNFLSSLPPSTTHLSLYLDDDKDDSNDIHNGDSNDIRNGDDNEVQTIDDTNIVFPTAAHRETLGQNTPHWIHKEEVATLICVLTFEIAHSCLQRDIT